MRVSQMVKSSVVKKYFEITCLTTYNSTPTSYLVTDYTFLQFFQQYGEVVDSIVLLDRRTKRSRGFGFVTFADEVCSYCPLQCLSILLYGPFV